MKVSVTDKKSPIQNTKMKKYLYDELPDDDEGSKDNEVCPEWGPVPSTPGLFGVPQAIRLILYPVSAKTKFLMPHIFLIQCIDLRKPMFNYGYFTKDFLAIILKMLTRRLHRAVRILFR